MKKRILFILTLITLIFVSSCSLTTSSDQDSQYDSNLPVTEVQTTYSKVYKEIYSSCIGVKAVLSSTSYSVGSAVIIKTNSSKTYALTNRHVVESDSKQSLSSNISVYLGDGYYISASVIAATTYSQRTSDESSDLALLEFKTPANYSLKAAEIENDVISKGQTVLAVGCPTSLTYYNTLTVGVVEKVLSSNNLIEHQATINPGNSGGGLFNTAGRLIGINVSKLSPDNEVVDNIGFAIDISKVRSFLSSSNFTL